MMENVSEDDFCNRCGDYLVKNVKHKCGSKFLFHSKKELLHRGRPKKNHGVM